MPRPPPISAPFPDASYKAGVRRFPNLVPDAPDAGGAALSREARAFWHERWTGKSLMAIGMKDPVLGTAGDARLARDHPRLPAAARNRRRRPLLQEWGEAIAIKALDAL